ncbi:pyruvate kinase [soil metagenome]
MDRRTKIVATLGPATDSPERLEAILAAGVDVCRINFSHGTADDHIKRIEFLRATAAKLGKVVAVLADLPGPKLRAKIASTKILTAGQDVAFSLTAAPVEPDDITITEPELLSNIKPGHRILLDDGRLILAAKEIVNGRVIASVLIGGVLNPNKGVNLPDTPLGIAAVTERDMVALEIAAKAGCDWLALSFVRSPDAAKELRELAAVYGFKGPIIAKIERPEAVDRITEIVAAFDAIMVARGDLGVEMALEKVPAVQKMLIKAARLAGKPVITATEMLESMTKNPRPTRAEASDVANAIYDGTDAVMLSGETAVGDYPVEAVACMARIALESESHIAKQEWLEEKVRSGEIEDPIAQAACELAVEIAADAIITPTLTGRTAFLMARHRPTATIVAPAPTPTVLRQMALVWGLRPVPMSPLSLSEDRMIAAVRDAFRAGVVRTGQLVVVLAGHPIEGGPRFPTVRVVRVGEAGASLEP